MTAATQFLVDVGRLLAIVVPAWLVAHLAQVRYIRWRGELAVVAEAVLTISLVLVASEVLGAFSVLGALPLIALLWVLAVATLSIGVFMRGRPEVATRRSTAHLAATGEQTERDQAVSHAPNHGRRRLIALSSPGHWAAATAVVVVAAQWCLQTADALGAGMYNFDTLWYHMPFAARFAQTGSIRSIFFTQADPITAYYPANSELLHAVGLIALRSDFLSPLLNLLWLALALVSSWCIGRPWRVQVQTLAAGCLVMGLPVLSATQPGEAFNDVAGLAMVLAGTALMVNADREQWVLATAGLALGFAVGTKYTFLAPALILLVFGAARAPARARVRTLRFTGIPLVLTAAWWYGRNVIATGNPLAVRMHIGPIRLPGPLSPLTAASQQTVLSELGHVSLWTSRFAPGLAHAFGALWFVIIGLFLVGALGGLVVRDWITPVIAGAALASAIVYLVFPTGATALEQGTTLFQVNLRYLMPAVALGMLLVPIIVHRRWPSLTPAVAFVFLGILLVAQLEPNVWGVQRARHAAFLLAGLCVLLAMCLLPLPVMRPNSPPTRRLSTTTLGVTVMVLAIGAGAFALERHYLARRYGSGEASTAGLAAVYRWAQHVADARIALYGAVTQYPLDGARVTNRVDYLGQHAPDGGYRPIPTCRLWKQTVDRGRYRYLVLTPAPTPAIPLDWTLSDPAITPVIHPAADVWVLRLHGALDPRLCS